MVAKTERDPEARHILDAKENADHCPARVKREMYDELAGTETESVSSSCSKASGASTAKPTPKGPCPASFCMKGSFVTPGSDAARSNAPNDELSNWFSRNTQSPGLCFLSPKAMMPGPSGAPVATTLNTTLSSAFALLELDDDAESAGSGSNTDESCASYDSYDSLGDAFPAA